MIKKIALLPGDGIGPEVIAQTVKVLNVIALRFHHTFQFTECKIGAVAIDNTGNPLPTETLDICGKSDAILFGAIGHPKYDLDPTLIVRPEEGLQRLRKELNLFANIRPIKSYRKLFPLSPLKEEFITGIDMIIYRELTGGIYFGQKKTDENGLWASDENKYHTYEIERLAHLAFQHARLRRKKLTLIDKANVLETGKLWRSTVQKLHSAFYQDIELDFLYVDNAAMQLILFPRQFDIILTENMFGDILSDEAIVLAGSIGLLSSASVGDGHALFEPIHGSYPQAAGKNTANPLASILSSALMMDHFLLAEEADEIQNAVNFCINEGFGSMDMAPKTNLSCSQIGEFIAELISADPGNWGTLKKKYESAANN